MGNIFESPTIRTGNKRVAPLIFLHLLNINEEILSDTQVTPAIHRIQRAAVGNQVGLEFTLEQEG